MLLSRLDGGVALVIERVSNVPCPGCACICDDVALTFEDGELVGFEPRCRMGEQWFRTHNQDVPSTAEINGQSASLEEAVCHAAELLQEADYPLVYGLSRSATPGQRAAVALAERVGAVIDTTASLCHGPSIMALQEVGEVTCTLGEVRNRADLVVFWGCHPAQSHPRHAERYSVFARGRHTPGGRADRTVVMVGDAGQVEQWRLDPAGAEPDFVVRVDPGQDFETLSMLRMMLRGVAVPAASDQLRRLLELMRGCRYGTVFFGLGITETSMWDGQPHQSIGHINVAALLQLVAELNAVTRFTARRMRLQGDVSGADNVLCWQTGYPFAVDLSRGYPRYNPGEFTANELLAHGDTDVCMLVGAETVPYFSDAARRHLQSIPTIVLDYPGVPLEFTPTVRFTTGVYGLHATGTAYRMDNVPVLLKAPRKSDAPTDERVLNAIRDRC
ncbi:MAG: formylmethanofuran dehydrogenase subunit B [Pirellulaceae bacterium]